MLEYLNRRHRQYLHQHVIDLLQFHTHSLQQKDQSLIICFDFYLMFQLKLSEETL
jgi:hypothetical protein